jgi:hypothetical protein
VAAARLASTLRYCEHLLQPASNPAHIQRLHHIRRILVEGSTPATQPQTPALAERLPIQWHAKRGAYTAETQHGTAVIKEIPATNKWRFGGRPRFAPHVSDASGVTLDGPLCSDFTEAETWIKDRLFQLSHPTGSELDYTNLQHTLEVCIRALPADGDPIHFFRLNWMDRRLADVLL